MSGFLNWRLKKWIRAVITRSFAIVPTIIVALYFNASETALDVHIPFLLIPLITLVSKEQVMGMFKIGPRMKVSNVMIPICIIFLFSFFQYAKKCSMNAVI